MKMTTTTMIVVQEGSGTHIVNVKPAQQRLVLGLGFGVWGLGFGVWGLELRASKVRM